MSEEEKAPYVQEVFIIYCSFQANNDRNRKKRDEKHYNQIRKEMEKKLREAN